MPGTRGIDAHGERIVYLIASSDAQKLRKIAVPVSERWQRAVDIVWLLRADILEAVVIEEKEELVPAIVNVRQNHGPADGPSIVVLMPGRLLVLGGELFG